METFQRDTIMLKYVSAKALSGVIDKILLLIL